MSNKLKKISNKTYELFDRVDDQAQPKTRKARLLEKKKREEERKNASAKRSKANLTNKQTKNNQIKDKQKSQLLNRQKEEIQRKLCLKDFIVDEFGQFWRKGMPEPLEKVDDYLLASSADVLSEPSTFGNQGIQQQESQLPSRFVKGTRLFVNLLAFFLIIILTIAWFICLSYGLVYIFRKFIL